MKSCVHLAFQQEQQSHLNHISPQTHTEPGGVPQRGKPAGPGVRLEGGEGTPAAGGL